MEVVSNEPLADQNYNAIVSGSNGSNPSKKRQNTVMPLPKTPEEMGMVEPAAIPTRRLAPILFLIVLTPMVEFLTGSSSLVGMASNIPLLLTFILVTIPVYTLPVLLIREALVAWNKGLPSLLSLGIAYGAINEGLAAKTYFSFFPLSPKLGGGPGVGRWLGINWPWVTEITLFHMIVSMSVPVALSFLIFPETRSQRFFTARGVRGLLAGLVVMLVPLNILEYAFLAPGFKGNAPLLILPVSVILVFVYIAHKLPKPEPKKTLHGILARPLPLALASLAFFIITFTPVLEYFPVAQIFSYLFYHYSGAPGIIATFYPIILAALAIRFFARYLLSEIQLLAIIGGVLTIPIITSLVLHDFLQGGPIAAIAYIASILAAWRRVRKK